MCLAGDPSRDRLDRRRRQLAERVHQSTCKPERLAEHSRRAGQEVIA